ncbi:unnamed protein product [Rhodiola kirilowii]
MGWRWVIKLLVESLSLGGRYGSGSFEELRLALFTSDAELCLLIKILQSDNGKAQLSKGISCDI